MSRAVRSLSVVLLALSLAGCGVPAEKGPADSFGIDFSMPPGSQVDGAIVFLVDGLNPDVFGQLLDKGELPAIKKYFVDRGLFVPRAASNIPCITMSCLTSIVTGQFPGHHGLIAPKWFDRNRLLFCNYETLANKNDLDRGYHAANLFEQFPDRLTFSLFFQPHRGATWFFENRLSAGPAMAFSMYGLIDRVAMYRFNQVMDVARRTHQFPAVSVVYLLSPNFTAYDFGFNSPDYRGSIRQADRRIGRILGDVQRAGLLDKLVIAMISDHGHADTPNHPAVDRWLNDDVGLNILSGEPDDEDSPFETRLAKYERVAGVTYNGGDRYWTVYLRRPIRNDGKLVRMAAWVERPTADDLHRYPVRRGGDVDLPAKLLEQKSIEAVAYRAAEDAVHVLFRSGEVEFRRLPASAGAPPADRPIRYRLVAGTHPPEWAGRLPADVLAGKPLTGRQWLDATHATEFPDLPEQILAHFDGKLAGDVVVFPTPGWDIDGWRKAGHGGIHANEMLAPMVLAGPGVPHNRLGAARSVDMMPTLLQLLGRPIPAGLDGRSLLAPSATTQPTRAAK
ncbi:MAG: alkaline phosphatase family protein [Phycisphaerae bacterium]|nr:alkaline phosphatase family protein [Phycisphaerae bacterium]